jgi:hypothetical protein
MPSAVVSKSTCHRPGIAGQELPARNRSTS